MKKKSVHFGQICVLLGAFGVGCSGGLKLKADPKKDPGSTDPTTAPDDEEASDPDASGDDGTTPIDDGSPGAVDQLLEDCGAKDLTNAAPDAVVYEATLQALPVKKNFVVVSVTIATTVAIRVTGATSQQNVQASVAAVSGILPTLVRNAAERQTAAASGNATFTNVPFSEFTELGKKYPTWNGVLCTVLPASGLENHHGEKNTTVTFDPPLPTSISPKAIAARYATEIGAGRVFDGITASVTATNDETLEGRTTVTGSVRIERVPPTATYDNGQGGQYQVTSDLAYRVTTNFGDPDTTWALGLPPQVVYYISHAKRDLTANVVDTSNVGGALLVFPHQ